MIYYGTDCTVNAKFGKLAGLSLICCIAGVLRGRKIILTLARDQGRIQTFFKAEDEDYTVPTYELRRFAVLLYNVLQWALYWTETTFARRYHVLALNRMKIYMFRIFFKRFERFSVLKFHIVIFCGVLGSSRLCRVTHATRAKLYFRHSLFFKLLDNITGSCLEVRTLLQVTSLSNPTFQRHNINLYRGTGSPVTLIFTITCCSDVNSAFVTSTKQTSFYHLQSQAPRHSAVNVESSRTMLWLLTSHRSSASVVDRRSLCSFVVCAPYKLDDQFLLTYCLQSFSEPKF
ncbi:hypothetical protein AGLY_018066 [Aphis glycines]|uniref:Uncharacterized protein n=1 Tax=Aphis glycines TaxID=307491 RepID=A0A6G0ST23_APHGL|nr:hypothetical protein AGLY_018066 [Aphis glycines]